MSTRLTGAVDGLVSHRREVLVGGAGGVDLRAVEAEGERHHVVWLTYSEGSRRSGRKEPL